MATANKDHATLETLHCLEITSRCLCACHQKHYGPYLDDECCTCAGWQVPESLEQAISESAVLRHHFNL